MSIPKVKDIPDVFVEVFGLPLRREIEFRIDLKKDARLVVMPLRHMAPKERRELEKQVSELLQKGFIHRSILEWERLSSSPRRQTVPLGYVSIIKS